MLESKVLVEGVGEIGQADRAFAKSAAKGPAFALPVRFANGSMAYLDMSDHRSQVWADVLRSLQESGRPAYVQLDAKTGMIRDLLLPMAVTVVSLKPADERGVEVELMISHARHWLRKEHAEYGKVLKVLQTALKRNTPMLITESLDTHEIIDVRPAGRAGDNSDQENG